MDNIIWAKYKTSPWWPAKKVNVAKMVLQTNSQSPQLHQSIIINIHDCYCNLIINNIS